MTVLLWLHLTIPLAQLGAFSTEVSINRYLLDDSHRSLVSHSVCQINCPSLMLLKIVVQFGKRKVTVVQITFLVNFQDVPVSEVGSPER